MTLRGTPVSQPTSTFSPHPVSVWLPGRVTPILCDICIRQVTLLFAMTIPLVLLGQAQPQSPFVVKFKYTKIDLPRNASSTCLAVFPDGTFHMEQGGEWPYSKPQVFDDTLPDEALKALPPVLDQKELMGRRWSAQGGLDMARAYYQWPHQSRELEEAAHTHIPDHQYPTDEGQQT